MGEYLRHLPKNDINSNNSEEEKVSPLDMSDDDGMYANTIEDMLLPEETLLWEGAPNKKAFIWEAILKMLPIALIWGAIDFGIIIGVLIGTGFFPWPLWIFFAFHLMPVWMWIAHIIHAFAEIKNIKYAITDKRVIERKGVLVDMKFLYFTEVNTVDIKVGIIERIFKVGDVNISSNIKTIKLDNISNPYKVGNYIQKIVRDIQTDIYFPNAMRPEENPGFNTRYTGSSKFE